jgi:hypothetical protein
VKHKDLRPWLSVIIGGESLVSHAGGVLLVETARRSGLAGQLSRLLGRWRKPLAVHDPGKIVTDLAVAVALGGDAAADIAVLRAQPGVFGRVASDSTVSRLIATLASDADSVLAAINTARAAARERVWDHAGPPVQQGRVVIDMDASLVTAHSDKQDATRTWKRSGSTRCWPSPITGPVGPGNPWPSCCVRGRPGRTPWSITSRCSTPRWPSYPPRCGPATSRSAGRCWCVPTPPAPPRTSPPTCTGTGWSSRSGRRWGTSISTPR